MHYDEDDGLVNNVVQSIVEDRDGKSGWVPNMGCPDLIQMRRRLIISFSQPQCPAMYIWRVVLAL